jgi:YebC/PmpR family DNA-binding regulatory protein
MAGHSKFKNIQHRKGAQDKRKAKIFTRAVREIITAAKSGSPDLDHNPRLRNAVISARALNLPKDRIEKAISQAQASGDDFNYIDIRYEGFASGGIAIIVEASTDNRNRTAADVRSVFSKFGGNLGETGSVSFMFDKLGFIEYDAQVASDETMLELVLELGANDVHSDDEKHIIYTNIEDFVKIVELCKVKIGNPVDSYLGWRPQNFIEPENQEKFDTVIKMIDILEDNDDVERVFTNCQF